MNLPSVSDTVDMVIQDFVFEIVSRKPSSTFRGGHWCHRSLRQCRDVAKYQHVKNIQHARFFEKS